MQYYCNPRLSYLLLLDLDLVKWLALLRS